MCIGLSNWRSLSREGRAEIAKPGHCDGPESAVDQKPAELQSLVKAAACAVNEQDRRSASDIRVFDRTARCMDDLAARGNARSGRNDVAPICAVDDNSQRGQERANDGQNYATRALRW